MEARAESRRRSSQQEIREQAIRLTLSLTKRLAIIVIASAQGTGAQLVAQILKTSGPAIGERGWTAALQPPSLTLRRHILAHYFC